MLFCMQLLSTFIDTRFPFFNLLKLNCLKREQKKLLIRQDGLRAKACQNELFCFKMEAFRKRSFTFSFKMLSRVTLLLVKLDRVMPR